LGDRWGTAHNIVIVAQKGSPAPGSKGNFTSFPLDSRSLALSPDGNVAFIASAGSSGIWFGKAGTLQSVVQSGQAAPIPSLGAGYTVSVLAGSTVEVNGRGELAFDVGLVGPGLNDTNSQFLLAGPPNALRVVAQSSQPAPGIPGASFRSFNPYGFPVFDEELIGADGTVVFAASYGTNGYDFGLWLAPTNGATPVLLMRNGQQAPGCPAGVVFTNQIGYLPTFDEVYLNARNEVVFHASLAGPGITNDTGIWLARPDGSVSLVVRTGDLFDIGGSTNVPAFITFGDSPETMAGPQDGRACPINDRGEVAFSASWKNPPGPQYFGSYFSGLFIAQIGLNLSAQIAGNDLRLSFPTPAGKHYRVDSRSNLSTASWSVLVPSVAGTGFSATVTDSGAIRAGPRFYRVARVD
jgi:hypothetical protein